MDHLLEILKIIEGGLAADRTKVQAYADQLADKLDNGGNKKAASRIRKSVGNSPQTEVNAADVASYPRVPVDGESRVTLADEQRLVTSDVEVFLAPSVQRQLEEFLQFVKAADQLMAAGVGVTPSMLLYGPPGCGKTEIGRFISANLGLPLLTARTDGMISSYLGSTAKNIRLLFEHAMGRPCILFLDEFDALAKLRDDQHELGELKRVVVSLLQNIDALDSKTVFLAATNHEHLLDSAIWRRFAFKLHVQFPELEARRAMYCRFLGDFGDGSIANLAAQASQELSGATIRQIAEDSVRQCVVAGKQRVPESDLMMRVLRYRLPAEIAETDINDEWIRYAKTIDPKVYTGQRLAEMFGISQPTVSRMLRQKGAADGH